MKDRVRLSIIVPVYNVEKWLKRCLDSLYCQGLSEEEFEVIVVNDGSPDSSPQIAKDYASKHHNMLVIDRENGGLSAARNTGLDHARGKYVWFVDSDDFAQPNAILSILDYAEVNNLDAMGFLFQYAYEDGSTKPYIYRPKYPNTIFSGEEFVSKTGFIQSPWAIIYRLDFLNAYSLRFLDGILHEDQEFAPRVQYMAKRIAHTDLIVYDYLQRTGSIMKSNQSDERVRSFLVICDSLYEFILQKHILKNRSADYFKNKLFYNFSQALSHYALSGSTDLMQFKAKPYYPLKSSSFLNKKGLVKVWMINHALPLYVVLLKLKNFINR